MFTGIVEDVGVVRSTEGGAGTLRVEIACRLAASLSAGDSIAVNGCCLTVERSSPDAFVCALTDETLRCTAFGQRLKPGTPVNLERPLRADGRLDGHIVQGHVDGVGRILALDRSGEAADLVVEAPPEIERYLVRKGSVAVDGISLTVADLGPGRFKVAIIPYTLEKTNLQSARPGDLVNLEADLIAKYVERLTRGVADAPR